MWRRSLTVLLVYLLVLPAVVWGQAQTSGAISGAVVDETGSPVEAASVQVTSVEHGLERETETDSQGLFLFGLLPVGSYSVSIVAAGFQPRVYSFRLGIGENVPVEVTLVPGEAELSEEITVHATPTVLRTVSAATNLDYRETIEQLPIIDRNVNDVATLAPQVSDNARDAFGFRTLAIAGAPSFDNSVLLDGAEISDPYQSYGNSLYLEDAIEEVQVLTSGISARYGRFQGGVINAITKSGSNRFEATLRYEFRRESWNSRTPFGEEQSDELDETFQLTGGGYFVEDRAWWFLGYRDIPSETASGTTTYTGEPFAQRTTEERWQVKLRGAPAANHIVDVAHLEYDRATVPWADFLPPGHLDALVGNDMRPWQASSATYQGVLTPDLFVELQATEKQVRFGGGGDPNGGTPFIDWSTFGIFNNYWWDASDPNLQDNETAAVNLTYAFETPRAGRHTVEAGIQRVVSTTGGENRQSPTGLNVIGWNPDFLGAPFAGGEPSFNLRNGVTERWKSIPLTGHQEVENVAVYAQDTVTLGDWRIDIGLRYDEYRGSGPLPQFDMAFDDLAPRLGLTYRIDDRWQAVATWGEYVSRLHDGVVQNATNIGNAPSIDHLYTGPDLFGLTAAEVDAIARDDAQWQTVSGFTSPDVVQSYLDRSIKAPVAEDWTLSLRHALARNAGTVVLHYVHRDFHGLLDDFVGGVCDYPFLEFDHPEPCPAANVTPVPDAFGNTAFVVDTTVWANSPAARRDYDGLSLQADCRPSARWGVGGSYTRSRTRGNFEGEAQNTPAIGSTMFDYPRSVSPGGIDVSGPLHSDVRDRLRAWAQYRFDFARAGELAVSGLLSFNTARNWNREAQVPLRGDPAYVLDFGTYPHVFTRGRDRFEDLRQLDVAVRYELPLYSKLGIWLKVTVINLFDEDALLRYQTTGEAVETSSGLQWSPTGSCGLDDPPNTSCTGFGRIQSQDDYQRPREFFFTVGLRY